MQQIVTVLGGIRATRWCPSAPGYKHAAVPILCASILPTIGPSTINNVPLLQEIEFIESALRSAGAISRSGRDQITVDARGLKASPSWDKECWSKYHASLYLMPSIAARFGHATVKFPGGCKLAIGPSGWYRPFEHVLEIMRAFGAVIDVSADEIVARFPSGRPHSAKVDISRFSDFSDA